MSSLVTHDPLATQVRELAPRDNLEPDEMLAVLVERYYPSPRPATYPNRVCKEMGWGSHIRREVRPVRR